MTEPDWTRPVRAILHVSMQHGKGLLKPAQAYGPA